MHYFNAENRVRQSVAEVEEMETAKAVELFINANISFWERETMRFYVCVLRHFARICPQLPATPEEIEAYYAIRKRDVQSIKPYEDALRFFYRFLEERHTIPNPMKSVRRSKRKRVEPRILDEQEQLMLVSAAEQKSRRDYALLRFFLDTMARAGEVSGLQHTSIIGTAESGYRVELTGKKGTRYIKLPRETRRLLEDLGANGYIFVNDHTNKPLTVSGIEFIVKGYLKAIGIDRKRDCCHLLRHSAATCHQERGGNPFELQYILGHSTLVMTQHYVHLGQRLGYTKQGDYSFSGLLNGNGRTLQNGCCECGNDKCIREHYPEGDEWVCTQCNRRYPAPPIRREG